MQNLSRKIVSLLECNHLAEIISPPLALRNSVFDIPKASSLSPALFVRACCPSPPRIRN
jgi:hypothetical protein